MTTVYYAHPMSWYGTEPERADLQLLATEFETVINPGASDVKLAFSHWQHTPMEFFLNLVSTADALVYRTFTDGKIGAGVAQEILHALIHNKAIIRIYSGVCGPVCGAPKLLEHMGKNIDLLYATLTRAETHSRVTRGVL